MLEIYSKLDDISKEILEEGINNYTNHIYKRNARITSTNIMAYLNVILNDEMLTKHYYKEEEIEEHINGYTIQDIPLFKYINTSTLSLSLYLIARIHGYNNKILSYRE